MKKRVLIDCDVGVDDALALILAFHSAELEVQAVTGVNGNVPLDLVFENIRKVLYLIHPQNKPLIAKGAEGPLKGKTVYAHSIHGRDGLGEAKIARRKGEDWWKIYPGRADELIAEMARRYPDELTLIATGPLTNVALGVQNDPEGMRKLKEVVIMGGAVRTEGNITPYAEFNVFSDPLAAKWVFESGLPITLVPLDVTRQVFLTSQVMEERVNPMNHPFSRFVVEAVGYDLKTHQFPRGSKSIYLHDPLAVGVAIDSNLVKKERLFLDIETEEEKRYGHISETREGSKIEVCLGVNSERFLELFLSRLG
jgi:purine nucleosidase